MSVALRVRRRSRATATPAAVAAAPADAAPTGPYVGLVTRALAFAIDAGIVNVVAIATAALVSLALSIISIPEELHTLLAAIGGAVYLLWAVGYFVTFWTVTGQTPGSRLLRIRVVGRRGEALRPRRALVRFVGLTLAALPLLAGFLLILVDDRRRGLHDLIARTVVVEAPEDVPARHAAAR